MTESRSSTRKATEKVATVLEPILKASKKNLVLVNCRFINQGKRRVLEVTLHKPGSQVSLDDCEAISRKLDKKLDSLAKSKEGPVVDGPFVLQVQSPGIDRKLKTQKELKVFKGEPVEVLSKEPLDVLGVHFAGILDETEDGRVTILHPKNIEKNGKKSSKKKKKKQPSIITPIEEVTVQFSALTYVRLSPSKEVLN